MLAMLLIFIFYPILITITDELTGVGGGLQSNFGSDL
jgi:hypothetical protein